MKQEILGECNPRILKIHTKYKIPSLNALFSMGHWGRKKEKDKAQTELLCGLSAAAVGSSTPTTLLQSICSTGCDTLASFMTTEPKTSPSAASKKKRTAKRKKKQ